ncbi:YwqG family protein [Actinacidiphila yeochonensis]|uniref:YwqG family protein n=1 Tax=Actinacidiphila yeochonensis TaxID=89050 RepID=UPI0018E31A0C|nr:YwqG family protein [Actinacidiphila yeochonensis]
MTRGTSDELRALALKHLPPQDAERWLSLLRPAACLEKATGSDPVVGQLGGTPRLPAGTDWPVWEGHGPLSFVASVDCAGLAVGALDIALDIALPSDGTLLFFSFDGQVDDGEALVLPDDPETRPGARVLFVPAGEATEERTAPEGLPPYPRVPLTARVRVTAPDPSHPLIQRTFGPDARFGRAHPVVAEEFLDALWALRDGTGHQIGGHADPVQNPVELEVAHALLGGRVAWDDPRLLAEANRLLPLAQIDSDGDAGMLWGDVGTLYWLIRPEDLAERRFDEAVFTWQCG